MHLERSIAGRHKMVDSEVGKVNLAVTPHYPVRPNESRRVENTFAGFLDEPEDNVNSEVATNAFESGGRRSRNSLGVLFRLVERAEAVTADRAFRKDNEPRATFGRLVGEIDDTLEVMSRRTDLHVHLNGGDPKRHWGPRLVIRFAWLRVYRHESTSSRVGGEKGGLSLPWQRCPGLSPARYPELPSAPQP